MTKQQDVHDFHSESGVKMNDDIYYVSIEELQHRIRTRDVSPTHIVERCLERIQTLNPRLNAFATVLADQALDQARQAHEEIQRGGWRGPLHGVPVGIKDFYDTAGVATTAAFERFKNRVPRADAVSVARLKDAGAVILGKMNMHTLGMGTTGLESCFGPVRNPWNDDFIPGGSSSGSAAAVAAGLCYATLDTDAIGSCRLPAACCGVIGFKGTYGLLSTKGILEGEQADESILWYRIPASRPDRWKTPPFCCARLRSPSEATVSTDPSGMRARRRCYGLAWPKTRSLTRRWRGYSPRRSTCCAHSTMKSSRPPHPSTFQVRRSAHDRSRPAEDCRTSVPRHRHSGAAHAHRHGASRGSGTRKSTGALSRIHGVRELLRTAGHQRAVRVRRQWPAHWPSVRREAMGRWCRAQPRAAVHGCGAVRTATSNTLGTVCVPS